MPSRLSKNCHQDKRHSNDQNCDNNDFLTDRHLEVVVGLHEFATALALLRNAGVIGSIRLVRFACRTLGGSRPGALGAKLLELGSLCGLLRGLLAGSLLGAKLLEFGALGVGEGVIVAHGRCLPC